MNKEQLKENVKRMEEQQIKLSVEIAEMKKELNKPNERVRGNKDDTFFYTNSYGDIMRTFETFSKGDDFMFATHNYYKTEAEAKEALELQTIENELCTLIEEINDGLVADFNNNLQGKYYLLYDFEDNRIDERYCFVLKRFKTKLYCKRQFRQGAIKRIGEKRLIKYLKNS